MLHFHAVADVRCISYARSKPRRVRMEPPWSPFARPHVVGDGEALDLLALDAVGAEVPNAGARGMVFDLWVGNQNR